MITDAMQKSFDRVLRLAGEANLPEVIEGTSYGTPALKVRNKSFVRMKDDATLVVMCPLIQKDLLLEVSPAIYFETDHYRGYPAVLVRLDVIEDEELRLRLSDAWREKAPRRLVDTLAARGKAGADADLDR